MTTHAHLVGSVALDTAEEVFATVGRLLGPYLKRVPDGEPGGRRLWTSWQAPLLRASPFLEPDPSGQAATMGPPLRLADGVQPDEIHFGELGYSREARTSYQDFLQARQNGDLPAGIRFQVSLPTPYAVIAGGRVVPESVPSVLPAYEAAMLREVERICARIPHRDLCLQWDVATEMVQWDGRLQPRPAGIDRVFGEQFTRLAAAVPNDVELGFHLCYGDLDGKHGIEPEDTTRIVEMGNLIFRSVGRPVSYLHLPVPIDRVDDAYYQPLTGLQRPAATELYLGLVHARDGVDGTLRRMAVARRYVPEFGIASECGISRGRSPRVAMEFLQVYAGAAAATDEVPA